MDVVSNFVEADSRFPDVAPRSHGIAFRFVDRVARFEDIVCGVPGVVSR